MAQRKARKQQSATINTSGGAVRISTPEGSRANQRSKTNVVVDVVTPNGFVGFLREHAVVGLAVGIVIGTQLKSIVDSLNNGFISPLFGLLFGGSSLVNHVSIAHWHGRTATLAWGGVVYQLIDFIFVMAVIYALIKIFNLDKLDQPKA
jgi:large conductance mechanosensitive channel protein